MRLRMLALLAVASLAAASCGSDPDVAVEAQPLAYGYLAGQSLSYDFTVDIEMSVDMDVPFSEQPPGNMAMEMSLDGILDFTVAAGPEPETFEVAVAGQITHIGGFSGTLDGEEITGADRAQLEASVQDAAPIPSLTMIVDGHGRVLSASMLGQELPFDVFGDGALGGGLFGSGATGSGLFGPEFPAGAVGVGDFWTSDYHEDAFGMSIDAMTTSEVVGAETMDGSTVFVIRSVMTLDPVTVSLLDMMRAIGGLDPEGLAAYGITPGDIDEMRNQMGAGDMVLSLVMDPTVTTTWFDLESGMTVKAESSGAANIAMSLRDPVMGSGMVDTVMRFEIAVEQR